MFGYHFLPNVLYMEHYFFEGLINSSVKWTYWLTVTGGYMPGEDWQQHAEDLEFCCITVKSIYHQLDFHLRPQKVEW